MEKSEIRENEIAITEYPFDPSLAYPNKIITANEISFISADFGLCRIYFGKDIIFITSEQKAELLKFAETNKIKLINHSWNWDWILEPYIDTEFTAEHEKRINESLNKVGFDKTETKKYETKLGHKCLSIILIQCFGIGVVWGFVMFYLPCE